MDAEIVKHFNFDHWYYRGEGNSSISIAHKEKHVILRLMKSYSREEAKEKLNQRIYKENIISPLIGKQFLTLSMMVDISPDLLVDINNRLRSKRPAFRLDRGLNLDIEHASLMWDACFPYPGNDLATDGPVFSFELKVKWGWLPPKRGTCKFCMQQHLKMAEQKFKKQSYYCPVDLFSGNRHRMLHSLKELVQSPQNNFRLFRNGELLWSEETRSDTIPSVFKEITPGRTADWNDLLELVIECLLHTETVADHSKDDLTESCSASCYKQPDSLATQNSAVCPANSVLGTIKESQKISGLDIEEVWPHHTVIQENLSHLQADSNFNLNKNYLWMPADIADGKQASPPTTATGDQPTLDEAVRRTKQFLVSKSIRDCSVMIAIQRGEAGGTGQQSLRINGEGYVFSTLIIDIDAKPYAGMKKYLKHHRKIMAAFTQSSKQPVTAASFT